MAESVDALVSNTSGATHPGSIPGLGTEAERVEKPLRFFVFLRHKGGSKNSEFRFYLFWCSPFRPLFVSFGVILSSLISHIARCASRRLDAVRNKSQTSLTFLLSPFTIFVSFFSVQKHTRKGRLSERKLNLFRIFRTVVPSATAKKRKSTRHNF